MTVKEYFSNHRGRYLLLHLLAMALVLVAVVYGVLSWLDVYTRHGEAVVVPDVKGISVQEAETLFRDKGLRYVVSDSNYVKTLPAGSILEHTPDAGMKVKEGRIIYLTINTLSIPLQVVPHVADNSSLRQAEARILAAGFKLEALEYIEGEKDWVYGVKYKNRELSVGEKAPMGATLTLLVGKGDASEQASDSLANAVSEPVSRVEQEGNSALDESWF